jgi:hypothetical protein
MKVIFVVKNNAGITHLSDLYSQDLVKEIHDEMILQENRIIPAWRIHVKSEKVKKNDNKPVS